MNVHFYSYLLLGPKATEITENDTWMLYVGVEGGGGNCWSRDQIEKETNSILLRSGICELLQRWSQKGQKILDLNEKWESRKGQDR